MRNQDLIETAKQYLELEKRYSDLQVKYDIAINCEDECQKKMLNKSFDYIEDKLRMIVNMTSQICKITPYEVIDFINEYSSKKNNKKK